jgi:hypothetical protein
MGPWKKFLVLPLQMQIRKRAFSGKEINREEEIVKWNSVVEYELLWSKITWL